MSVVRIATRGSALALAQSQAIGDALARILGVTTELVVIKTTGDRLTGSLAAHGGKGLFIKEVEEAVLAGRAELAVHSAKDLPAALAPGLRLAAFPERADPRDALVTRSGLDLDALREGARVGTGSLRRQSLLLARRPDLRIEPLRGNVDTRLHKLEAEKLDAIVLACAGLERLGLAARIGQRLAPEVLLPAVGQGTLALEAREGEAFGDELTAALDHRATRLATLAERAFLQRLAGDCNVPLAAHARLDDTGRVFLHAALASPDGRQVLRASTDASAQAAATAGQAAAESILSRGGEALLAALPDLTKRPPEVSP